MKIYAHREYQKKNQANFYDGPNEMPNDLTLLFTIERVVKWEMFWFDWRWMSFA